MDIAMVVDYVKTHIGDFLVAYSALVTVASIIVKLTPTQADDAILQKVMDFLGKYIALNKDKTQGK